LNSCIGQLNNQQTKETIWNSRTGIWY
jgi:hypothetical protein